MNIKLRYIQNYADARGKQRYYVRYRDTRFPLPDPGPNALPSVEFMDRYDEITKNLPKAPPAKRSVGPRVGVIYVVGFDNYVKIGFASDLAKRISTLQTGCPRRLKVHLAIPGTVLDEDRLHRQFRFYRLAGEWFELTGDLLEWTAGEQGKKIQRQTPPKDVANFGVST